MRRLYAVGPLLEHEIGPAFAMVQALYSGIPFDSWDAFARTLIGAADQEGRAIVGMRAEDGYLSGLFAHRVEASLEHGRVLVVDPIAVLDLVHPQPAMRSMISAIERAAEGLGCSQTCVYVRSTHASLGRHLINLGYAPEAQILVKPIATLATA